MLSASITHSKHDEDDPTEDCTHNSYIHHDDSYDHHSLSAYATHSTDDAHSVIHDITSSIAH